MNVSRYPGRGSWLLRESGLASPFGLALIGLAIVLGWVVFGFARLSVSVPLDPPAAAVPAAAQPTTMTYREPATNGSLISSDVARQSARSFSGQPELVLNGSLQRGPAGDDRYPVYFLENAANGGAAVETYKVDARTGEVIEMTRLGGLEPQLSGGGLGPIDAEHLAEQFVADRFLGFGSLSLVERTVAQGPQGSQLYVFKWAMVAPHSGAELPTSVAASLSSASGEVIWYLAQRESVAIDVQPVITRDTALGTAAELVDRAGRWDARAPSSVRLQVVHDRENRQQLAWAITFPGRQESGGANPGRPSLQILIDAKSGQPLANPA